MFEDDDNDYILLVLGVLAAVLLIAVPGIIRQDNTGIPDLGAAEVSDDGAVEDDDLFERTRDALDGDGFAAAGLTIAGTTAVLDGEVASEELREQAGETAAAVEGVTAVENNLVVLEEEEEQVEEEEEEEVAAPPADLDPSAVTINYTGDENGLTGATLTGVVADEAAKTQLVEQVIDQLGGDPTLVDDQLEIDDNFTMEGASVTTIGELSVSAADTARGGFEGFEGTGFSVTDEIREAEEVEPPGVTLETSLNELVGLEPIQFDVGQATIRPESQSTLDQAAEVLNGAPDGSVVIEGHTDNDGDAGANLTLSQARAQSVLDALVERGVDAGRLTPEGFGETEPIGDNGTDEGRQQNRRIEFSVS